MKSIQTIYQEHQSESSLRKASAVSSEKTPKVCFSKYTKLQFYVKFTRNFPKHIKDKVTHYLRQQSKKL